MCVFIFRFYSCDLDLDSMTLTYKFDLDIGKMDPHTKNEVSRSRLSKVRARTNATDRHADRQTKPNVLQQPHTVCVSATTNTTRGGGSRNFLGAITQNI